jgi:hypothetical protein
VEVQRWLWTVNHGDLDSNATMIPSEAIAAAGSSARECSASELALIRMQALAQSLDDIAAAQGTSAPPSVLAESFMRWQSELDAAHKRFLQLAEREPVTSEARDQARAALEAASKVRQRLIQAGVVEEDTVAAVNNELALEDGDESALHVEVVGRGTELGLDWQPTEPGWALSRAAIACGILAMTLLVWIAIQFAAARDWLAAHGHFALAAVGFAWWLVAPFGWLGWLPVIAAAWLAIRPPGRPAAFESGSTLRRVARSMMGTK